MIHEFKGIKPEIAEDVFVAPSADIIGRVKIAKGSSVWFNVTIRADVDDVVIGENVSIQDNCCLHQTEGYPLIIGDNVTVGHAVTLHGCKIADNTLIGMGARIILCDPHRAVVSGPARLRGAELVSPDVRAGMAMVLAALCAEGKSEIQNVYQIERGYERLAEKLTSLGARIERV